MPRFVAQSFANFWYAREGGPAKTEDDQLGSTPVAGMGETAAAMSYLDQVVTDAGGIALRYGSFYGAPKDGLRLAAQRRATQDSARNESFARCDGPLRA